MDKRSDHDLLIEIHTIVTNLKDNVADFKKQATSEVGFTRCAKRGERINSLEESRRFQKYIIAGISIVVLASLIISLIRFAA